jgi:hypothetical protein
MRRREFVAGLGGAAVAAIPAYIGMSRDRVRMWCMTTPLEPTTAPDRIDLDCLLGQIAGLMVRYCDAIEACRSVPTLSLLPLPKLYFQSVFWVIGAELCIVLGPIDLTLFFARRMVGRPHLVVGRGVYNYLARPLRSIWKGEMPSFMILRLRYLTRLLLFYHAQYRINALQSVFNRRHLDLLVTKPPNSAALHEAEEFQKSFDLFQKITTDSYRFGALAVGGPFVVLLSIVIQQWLIPALTFLWGYFGGPKLGLSNELIGTLSGFFILFGVCTIWILVSAWMDMRSVLIGLDVYKTERVACAYARIKACRNIPFDLLLYISMFGFLALSINYTFAKAFERVTANLGPLPEQQLSMLHIQSLQFWILIASLSLCFGLVALARRVWLTRRIEN